MTIKDIINESLQGTDWTKNALQNMIDILKKNRESHVKVDVGNDQFEISQALCEKIIKTINDLEKDLNWYKDSFKKISNK